MRIVHLGPVAKPSFLLASGVREPHPETAPMVGRADSPKLPFVLRLL